MKDQSTSKNIMLVCAYISAWALWCFVHIWRLDRLPGLHFDEAWAANYAAKMVESGQLFWQGMSPFTLPLAQYAAALWFQLFGTDIFIYRLSQLDLAAGGLCFLSLALWRLGERRAALLLPLLQVLFLGVVTNHRFAIELTGMHELAFGLFVCGLVLRLREAGRWADVLLLLGTILGTYSHVLFLAVPLSVILLLELHGLRPGKRDRNLIFVTLLFLLPFFLRITVTIPTPTKGILLLCLLPLVALWACWDFERIPGYLTAKKFVAKVILAASCVFAFNAVFFLDGSWGILRAHGVLTWPYTIGISVFSFLLLTWWQMRRARPWLLWAGKWFLLLSLMLGVMMLKPTPRYFHLALVWASVVLALQMAFLRPRHLTVLLLIMGLGTGLTYWQGYQGPLIRGESQARAFRSLFFKDSSRDFLPKQPLVDLLASKGCARYQVQTADPRLATALDFLARGDWPPLAEGDCDGGQIHVELEGEADTIAIKQTNSGSVAGYRWWIQDGSE